MPDRSTVPHPDRDGGAVVLRHPLFSKLGEVVFRLGEGDGVPVLVMPFGDKTAALPLRSLQVECGIEDDSEDGRMLFLIARALAFVNDLRPGQALPAEVLGGEASWAPDAAYVRLAVSRIELRFVAQFAGGAADKWEGADAEAILATMDDPTMRHRVQAALAEAAGALGLPGAQAVLERVEDAARELACIEALRARLLHRVQALLERLEGLVRASGADATRFEVVTGVRRLTGTAVAHLQARFEDLDAQTGEVVALVRNLDNHRDFIRAHRDWLYGSLRGWEPILVEWERAGADWNEATQRLIERTYRFLAPRYMPTQEWRQAAQAAAERARAPQGMTW